MHTSQNLQNLPPYAFAQVDKLVEQLKEQKVDVIDFGVGDPTDPTPEFIRKACKKGIEDFADAGYPSYLGRPNYWDACARYMKRRFGVTIDPKTQVLASIGSKEVIFNTPLAFIEPGDIVLCPTPGYPPYKTGTLFAYGKPYFYPLLPENNFLPSLEDIPEEILKKTKMMWIGYPNNPTGAVATKEDLKKIYDFCRKNDIILCSDECYTDLYFGGKPPASALELATEGVLVFQSLSKRNNMTGYRIGFVTGDPVLVQSLKNLKRNIDSGVPNFIQSAGIAALDDEEFVAKTREDYREKARLLTEVFTAKGYPDCFPKGTIYLWQQARKGETGLELAKKLLDPAIGVVCTPGSFISEVDSISGKNPAENFVRFALVPPLERVREAAGRIRSHLL